MPSISDIGQTVSHTDNLVTIGLTFDKGNKIDVAVRRDGSSHAGSYQDHADKIASTTTTDMTHSYRDKLLKSRLFDWIWLFRRLRHRQEFRLQFLRCRNGLNRRSIHA